MSNSSNPFYSAPSSFGTSGISDGPRRKSYMVEPSYSADRTNIPELMSAFPVR